MNDKHIINKIRSLMQKVINEFAEEMQKAKEEL